MGNLETCFKAETLDDAMRCVFEDLLEFGEPVTASRGANREISGAVFEITQPLSRISHTETRGKPFSCLGEFCWYFSASDEANFISYYVPNHYREFRNGHVPGAYGPRLFNWRGTNQVENIVDLLGRKNTSRQAVIQLFDASDVATKSKDVPCTCVLQFTIRNEALHLITYMRSNDAFLGLPHDVFCFTMLQEVIARRLQVSLGTYKHIAGSIHLYNEDVPGAKRFLKEGLQSTLDFMPEMPANPSEGISALLSAETQIREGHGYDRSQLAAVHPYWADLIRLLMAFRFKKDKDPEAIRGLVGEMECKLYYPFLDSMMKRAKKAL